MWIESEVQWYVGMAMREGGDGFYILRPHTRFSYIYSLPYSYLTGMKNWTTSPSPTGSGILAPSPHRIIFLIKNRSFFQPLEKCCNALSSNMLILTFVRSIDLVAHLNINGSFYNTAIIKQNKIAYQHKVIFCIRDGFEYRFGMSTYIPVTRPIPVFWNRGKLKLIPKPSQNGKIHQIGFCSRR